MTAIKNGTLLVKDSNGNTARVATLSQTDITTLNTALADIDVNKKKINSISANYVTTNTEQDITAVKTFKTTTNHVVTKVVVTDRDNSVTPTEEKWTDVVRVFDKNNTICGVLAFNQWVDGSNSAELHAVAPATSDVPPSAYIGIRGFKDGSFKTMCYTPQKDSNSSEIATTEWVNSKISTGGGSNPVGSIIPFAGSSIPTGYLLCNGAVVSRATYANLFRVIGTAYGAGDGSTTFKLPDLRDRFLEGAGTNAIGRYLSAGLPNITGTTGKYVRFNETADAGALSKTVGAVNARYGTTGSAVVSGDVIFNASKSNTIYSKSTTVQPNAITVQYLIKY